MSLNRVTLIGRVGQVPDVRDLNNGNRVASFSLATTERGFTTKDGRQIADRTEWHNIVVYGGLVKVVERYVNKGDQLYVEGALRYRSYDGNDGNKRYITEIFADDIQLLTPRNTAAAGMGAQPDDVDPLPWERAQ